MTHHDRFLLSVRLHGISSQHLRLSLPLRAPIPQSFPVLFHENENKKMRIFIFFLDFLPDSHACFDSEIKCSFLWVFGGTNPLFLPIKTLHCSYVKVFKILGFFFFWFYDLRFQSSFYLYNFNESCGTEMLLFPE